jgi:hypothetical protein
MHRYLGSLLLLGAITTIPLAAQSEPAAPHFEVAATYNAIRSNLIGSNSFSTQGGSVQAGGRFWRGLGVITDVAGMHTGNVLSSGVGLDVITATLGPRYTWLPAQRKLSLFGQGLVGEASGFNSVFPSPSGATSEAHGLAVLVGGGMNVNLSRRLGLRAIQADWVRTQLPNSTTGVQNNLRIGAGVVYRFGSE